MTAAIEASKTGYEVVLVEKTGALGGWAAKLYKRVPVHEPYKSTRRTPAWPNWSRRCRRDSNIKVYLNATVAKTDGAPGRFVVDIATESGATHTEDIGAIVQATGFTLYDMNKLPELGGGKSPNVVDQAGLEALATAAAAGDGVIRRPSDGAAGEVGGVRAVRRPARHHAASICRTARATAATPASSRRCTSRTPTRPSTPPSSTPTCARPATARTSTAARRKKA